MPLTLPNLDDVTWAQLNEEARSLIPGYAPEWTNFNASDPGITILELLAYFTEILNFRTNQIAPEQIELFLRLLQGPGWRPKLSLDEERQRAVTSLGLPRRAVTLADFEDLSIRATDATADGKRPLAVRNRVARARCIANRNLEQTQDESKNAFAPGHISVVIATREDPMPTAAALARVKIVLHEVRLITTRVHVVPCSLVPFGVRVTLFVADTVSTNQVSEAAIDRLQDFFHPLRGGIDEKGWPFGKSIYVSELYQLLTTIPGVDYVMPSAGSSDNETEDELYVGPSDQWRKQLNAKDELLAIELMEHELAQLRIEPGDIVIQRRRGNR